MEDWPVHDVGPWPEGLSLRREDMYGDEAVDPVFVDTNVLVYSARVVGPSSCGCHADAAATLVAPAPTCG